MGIRLYTGEFLRETGLEPFRATVQELKTRYFESLLDENLLVLRLG